jgi:hypothetical protein
MAQYGAGANNVQFCAATSQLYRKNINRAFLEFQFQ